MGIDRVLTTTFQYGIIIIDLTDRRKIISMYKEDIIPFLVILCLAFYAGLVSTLLV